MRFPDKYTKTRAGKGAGAREKWEREDSLSLTAPFPIFVPRTDKTSNLIRKFFYEIYFLNSKNCLKISR